MERIQKPPVSVERVKFTQIFEAKDASSRKTKICCTLGPACWDTDGLVKMIDNGMDVARLNYAQHDPKSNETAASNLKQALRQRPEKTVAIMLDTKGPEIMTGEISGAKAFLKKDETIEITTNMEHAGDNVKFACDFEGLPESVSQGQTILIDGRNVVLEVQEVIEDGVRCIIKKDCTLGENKVLTIPGACVDLPILTEEDAEDIQSGVAFGIDYVAATGVRKSDDIESVHDALGKEGQLVKVIAKIQNQEALNNFDEILASADGIMICRSDLAMEVPPEKIFIAQKWMTEKANIVSKPILIADECFASMITNVKGTRTEAVDICNAIQDGIDGIVLGDACADGAYPLESVSVVGQICAEAEANTDYKRLFSEMVQYSCSPATTAEAVACSAVSAVNELNVALIIVLTDSGKLGRLVCKYKPSVPVMICSQQQHVVEQLNLTRGTVGFRIAQSAHDDTHIGLCTEVAKDRGYVEAEQKVIVVEGRMEESPEEENISQIIEI